MINFTAQQLDNGYLNRTPKWQFILICLLYPIWGAIASLNDILITQFQFLFSLTNLECSFVQIAYFAGYFLTAIPASRMIKQTSYKFTIVVGLLVIIFGSMLFLPAAHLAVYVYFLISLFLIAVGLSFTETAADTYNVLLGNEKQRSLRLNIAQTFLPIGSVVGILLGQYLIFSKGLNLKVKLASLSESNRLVFIKTELLRTLQPYKYLLIVLIILLMLYLVTKFPQCKPQKVTQPQSLFTTVKTLLKNKSFVFGLFTEFMYVSLEVSVWTFVIRLVLYLNPVITEQNASTYAIYAYIAFFFGRLIADKLIQHFNEMKVLLVYCMLGFITIIYIVMVKNISAIYAAVLVSGIMGPGYATIYAETLGYVKNPANNETAGALIVMTLIGGAFGPFIQGWIADITGSISISFVYHLLTFGTMIGFSIYSIKQKKENYNDRK
ncbi:MFS transporter [Fructilactobacillus sp. Tb1]|uniref:MFS transporter n=1 Tax=Fructilactobacillus sp. Tb1 TaxID=3422304 RepID=UPI003D29F408